MITIMRDSIRFYNIKRIFYIDLDLQLINKNV